MDSTLVKPLVPLEELNCAIDGNEELGPEVDVAAGSGTAVTGGMATLFMSKAYIAGMLANNIVVSPVNPWSVSTQDVYTTTKWWLRGGDADLSTCKGLVRFDGSSLVSNIVTGRGLLLANIRLNLENGGLDYTVTAPEATFDIHGLESRGTQSAQVKDGVGTFTATALYMNADAGAAMNDYLDTKAFLDTNVFGAFATTFRLADPSLNVATKACP